MRVLILATITVALAACASAGPNVPQDQAAQFQQAGAPFPYNSFYCP